MKGIESELFVKGFYAVTRWLFYIACAIPGLLLVSSFGSMTDSDAGSKLTRGIIAVVASAILAVVGLVSSAIASNLESPFAGRLWIATAIASAPGILTFVAVTLAHR